MNKITENPKLLKIKFKLTGRGIEPGSADMNNANDCKLLTDSNHRETSQ